MFDVPVIFERIIQMMSPTSRSVTSGSNTGMSSLSSSLDPSMAAKFLLGTVLRSDVGWYGVLVRIDGKEPIPCAILTTAASSYLGVSQCSLPIEGSRVLVFMDDFKRGYGIVIGIMPPIDSTPFATQDGTPSKLSRYASMWELESNASVGSNSPYSTVLSDKTIINKISAGGARPLDVTPGSFILMNDQHVGLGVTALAATLKANARAQVRVSGIDDQVRVVSGHFVHYSSAGLSQCFNDGGYITEETGVASYQCERMGLSAIGEPAFEEDTEVSDDIIKGLKTICTPVKPKLSAKNRLQSFIGYLGDLVNIFVANPDPSIKVETADSKAKDQGLANFHMDASGHTTLRTAGGISLQRFDRIPIPKRISQPWDPAGDKVEDDTRGPLTKTPFEFGAQTYSRAAKLRDATAWRDLGAYWRIHNQSTSTQHKDFYLPEESELKTPDNQYDAPGSGFENFSEYDKRKSFLNMEPDGSIIIRDAWGSEIVMAGGNITITCPGQLQFRSGKSTVVLAGHDLVMKAQESVDCTAERHDVRIKADSKVEVVATGQYSGNGGIILESLSRFTKPWTGTGEAGAGSGVVIKADRATVMVQGNKVDISGKNEVQVETFSDQGNTGKILMSANTIESYAKSKIIMTSAGKSGILITEVSAVLAGPSVTVAGETTTSIATGDRVLVAPTARLSSGAPYAEIAPNLTQLGDILKQPEGWIDWTPEQRPGITFSYRTSTEYGTTIASELSGGKFMLYQPTWAFMASKQAATLGDVKISRWSEHDIKEGYPWPGADARNTGYMVLAEETNVNSKDGIAKDRGTLTANSEDLVPKTIDERETITHT